jgi:hypothetical protein
MPIAYDSIVPWGRSYDEYVAMFGLTAADLDGPVLGCADGPASFNATMAARGRRATSVDPLYAFTAHDIEQRIAATFTAVIAQTRAHADRFVWKTIRTVEELGERRMAAMRAFLADYERGRAEGRYVDAALPHLPFAADQFDLALSSHFLFLYSDHLSCAFHCAAIDEMLRVAREVRVFPPCDYNADESPHLAPVIDHCRAHGHAAQLVPVDYEFQQGANKVLVITRHARYRGPR